MKQLIFCDLELTQGLKHQRYFSPEVIQIGATKVDKDFKEISRFNRYVKPIRNPYLNEYLMAKTGISQYVINHADTLNIVLKEFEDWIGDINNTSFIFWGKEDVKVLGDEIRDKGYNGNLSINKYFNFQSYLQSKLARPISLKNGLETFKIPVEGTLHDALWDAINMKNLYIQTIIATDSVNKLWFEGKIVFIIKQFEEIIEYLNSTNNVFSIEIKNLTIFINKCRLLLELINNFSDEEREVKLNSLRKEIEFLTNEMEELIISQFRKDTMAFQFAVIKKQIPKNFENKGQMVQQWSIISKKYKYFSQKRSGTYATHFYRVRDMYKRVGDGVYSLCRQN
ncbi:MAG: exonuclease [Clostridiaceae bacterium]|jgi:inhibitor of KinA sporulation pathway (predicted exonuclease)|nr:exonuclease [Clostridiaceae bacterium]